MTNRRLSALSFPRALVALFVLVPCLSSCGHAGAGRSAAGLALKYPAWIRAGSAPLDEPGHHAFVGVGHVAGIRNVALARSTADNRARAEVARIFEAFGAQLMAKYQQAQGEAGKGATQAQTAPSADELTQEQALKVFAAASLSGVQIVQHWYDPEDGSVFSQARLELNHFADSTMRVRELSAALRDWLQEAVEPTFKSYAQQHAQHQQLRQQEPR